MVEIKVYHKLHPCMSITFTSDYPVPEPLKKQILRLMKVMDGLSIKFINHV